MYAEEPWSGAKDQKVVQIKSHHDRGAPFFHAGNARSLEELLENRVFLSHAQSLGAVFTPTPTTVKQLTAYLLSIDESVTPIALPAGPSAEGGDICHYP